MRPVSVVSTSAILAFAVACQTPSAPQAKASMPQPAFPAPKRFEYYYGYSKEMNPTRLNQLGEQGWELVATVPPFEVGNTSNTQAQFIFKRAK